MLKLKSFPKAALPLMMICLCGLGLRLFQIAQESISLDEATSLNIARMSLKDLNLHLLNKDVHPPLYFILLHFWQKADQGITFLRLFSVLIGLLTIPSVYFLGKVLFDRSTGLIAAFFLAISPVHISSSQTVRGYVLLLLLTVLGLYCLLRAASSGKWLWWGLYFMATMGSLFTHYFAVFTVFFQGLLVPLALIIKRVPFRRWHQWVLISVLVGLFFASWIVNSGILTTGVSPGWLSYEPDLRVGPSSIPF